MEAYLILLVNSLLLGVGLAMDAFSVSIVNGINEYNMKQKRMAKIAFVYAFFQMLMPLIGWVCIHTIVVYFNDFRKIVPWISFVLLFFIGGKMVLEGVEKLKENKAIESDEDSTNSDNDGVKKNSAIVRVSFHVLIMQGIATSIDALSVGFAIAEYKVLMAFISAFIIGIVTYVICFLGLKIGKKLGSAIGNKASIFGGVLLVLLGFELLFKGIL